MRRFSLIAAVLLMAASCSKPSAESYLDWLYDNMPMADSISFPRSYWQENVERTLQTRSEMGWDIPEREFRHFVLPVRVNNETLDDFRTVYADTLCARVKGMDIARAALEINHWCHEQATYKPSDARTSSPMATVRNGVGRCGEESVLAVAALRAAGIPARQVYTPRWAHTDDNHAWVEVWADGAWHFMGACEPEPRLNMAWFNAPVSRAMLLHTNVFGRYDGPEDVIGRSAVNTEINVIRGYVPARVTTVSVVDEAGAAVPGASVAFTIYNYGEFFEVARYETDADGIASLNTGCGDMLVFASHEGRFGFAVAHDEQPVKVVLSHAEGERFSADVTIVPPAENPIPSDATREDIDLNASRLAQEDSIRASHDHSNHDLQAFLASGGTREQLLVSMLTAKDLCDVTGDVLEDALVGPGDDPYVLSPRVEREALKPFRKEALASVSGLEADPLAVAEWVDSCIVVDDARSPRQFRISPVYVLRARRANTISRNIFYVALCRALGVAARIDEVSGAVQYRDAAGCWASVFSSDEKVADLKGGLRISYSPVPAVKSPKYYRHFSISRMEGGRMHLLEYGSDADDTPLSSLGDLDVERGYYLLTSGSRMADGSVLAHMEFFSVGEGLSEVPLVMRESDDALQVLGSMDADRFLPLTGRGYYILAVLGDRDEPSVHAKLDLAGLSEEIKAWGRPAVVLQDDSIFNRSEIAAMLSSGCDRPGYTLPVVTVCDSFGRIVYYSQGYNTSLPSDLRRVLSKL